MSYQLFTKMPSKRMKYTAKFKLQVVKFAQESNHCTASRKFGVNKKLLRDWRKQVEKLKCMPENMCNNREKWCQWPELEDKLQLDRRTAALCICCDKQHDPNQGTCND